MTTDDLRHDLPVLLLHNVDQEWAAGEREEAAHATTKLESALREIGHLVTNVPIMNGNPLRCLDQFAREQFIVFNWCEELPGIAHSDALVAGTLESMGFTYTGSPASVLALSWHKEKVKSLLADCGLPVPYWQVYQSSSCDDWHSFPAIVKPAFEHCSAGITPEAVVLEPRQLQDRIAYILDVFRQAAMVEEFIDGREFHVSLWGNDSIEMLPPVEMDFSSFTDVRDRLCTYESKFQPGSLHYEQICSLIPAPLSEPEYRALEKISRAAYRAHRCRDYARLDIRLRDGVFYILDINPNPDISYDASMACAAETAGFSYGIMGSILVNLAARRHCVFGKNYLIDPSG